MEQYVSLISNFGFPICTCLIMFKFFKYMYDENKQEVQSLTTVNQESVEQLRNEISANTIALTQLCERLDRYLDEKNSSN